MDRKEISKQFYRLFKRMPELREILYTEMTGQYRKFYSITKKDKIALIIKYPKERIMAKGPHKDKVRKVRDRHGKREIVRHNIIIEQDTGPRQPPRTPLQRAEYIRQWHLDRSIDPPEIVQNLINKYNL